MTRFDSSEFKFEEKLIKVPKLKRNINAVFRIPVPNENFNTNLEPDLDSTHPISSDSSLFENHHSVNVRAPFKNLIERNIEHVEKLFDVRMFLQQVDDDFKLLASGPKAESSINEILNICRKSNVYNFYLCFPVRGEEFHKKFTEFKKNVLYKLGSNLSFEKRPHITLALVNLVTDSDIDLVVRALQLTSMTIKSLPKKQTESNLDDYYIHLEGLDVVRYKGKFAKRSVLMSNVTLSETLSDIASEFQTTLNRSVNTLINSQPKRKKISRSDRLSNLTESQLAPKGIFLTRRGDIEITFTDVPLVDPKACAGGEGDDAKESLQSIPEDLVKNEYTLKSDDGLTNHLYEDQNLGHDAKPAYEYSDPTCSSSFQLNGSEQKFSSQPDVTGKFTENNLVGRESEDDEVYEFDTSVRNKFHVTLMRHQQVSLLSNIKFSSKGHVVCVELRPRNGECCNFMAYNSNELISFVGNTFDNKENQDISTSQLSGSQPPKIPNHYLVDLETEKTDDKEERFVFWI